MPPHRRHFLAASVLALGDRLTHAAAPKTSPASPFLAGNYAPVREEIAADNLRVVGRLPSDLEGMFVRNGPNPQFEPRNAYHWFDGDGMLHGVLVRDGRASYRNRYVRTEGWQEERKASKALYDGLLGMPNLKKLARGKDGFKNSANTALIWHNGQLLALWEGGAPHAVRVPDLATLGRHTFGGKLKHACTAHPKIDPATGEMMFFGYQPVRPYVQYSVANARGVLVRTTPIDVPRPVMMHDFAVTARHTIFMDLPVTFHFGRALRGRPAFAYEPQHGARFGVLPRHGKGSDVKWFASPACYVFHTLNACDDGDEVVLLASRMKAFPATIVPPDSMTDRQLEREGASLYRWRFNLKTGKVREGPVDDVAADFPRLHDGYLGRKARHGYLMRLKMDGFLKYDLDRGTSEAHALGKGRFASEGVFVPRPGARREDDGWLVAYVYDAAAGKSEMVVIEAGDFRARPVARVLLPARVPYGFHGTWLPVAVLREPKAGRKGPG